MSIDNGAVVEAVAWGNWANTDIPFSSSTEVESIPRQRVKAVFDRVLALLLLIPAAPVILLTAILVRLTSRGPAFYNQTRLGLRGKPYFIYKLRTMFHDCERVSGARWSTAGDSRITPLGRFLRKTHLDELPQLWNVLKGEMSLVGPRPERPEFVPQLEAAIPGYRERLQVRPGVTGLAQVQLPADTNLDSVRRKLVYDLYYIENAGVWLDLKLILCTGFKMLHVPFGITGKLLRVPGRAVVEGQETAEASEVVAGQKD
jgi:lipopolysaccharide/colanic/teichoic acid biosynthesis glycosyltransferase